MSSTGQKRQKRSSASAPLPGAINRLVGRRLRALRESRGLSIREVPCFAMGSLGHYEIHNASTMRLGDLIAYAKFLGIEPLEFFSLLLVEDEEESLHLDPQRLRVETLMRSMSPQLRMIAIDILESLTGVEHQPPP